MFCEDIREEKSGQDMLIGIIPDHVGLSEIPGSMGKVALYVRVHLDATGPRPKRITSRLIAPNAEEVKLPDWTTDTIDRAFSDAATNGMPLVGLLMKAVVGSLHVAQGGIFKAVIDVDGTEYVAANLRVFAGTPPTASQPPASQPAPVPQAS
jgi:hypothetical protein